MIHDITGIVAIICIFVVLPAILTKRVSQWRQAKGITIEDERLLDDLHDTARRLDQRLESIERIIAADNPGWRDGALGSARPVDRIETQADAEPRLAYRR